MGDLKRVAGVMLTSPLGTAYRGKVGCTNPTCTHDMRDSSRCYGWHCILCDEPTDAQGGHHCLVEAGTKEGS